MHKTAVILGTARTPFGRLGGALAGVTATSLAAVAIRAALERAGVDPRLVEHVILGQVLQAGVGQAPARQASLKAGLAPSVTAETVNKVCASGMLAVANAARLVCAAEARLVVAGGMESMSNAPYVLPGARAGLRYGDGGLHDSVLHDGLLDVYLRITMADAANRVARELGPPRDAQDAFAYQSHRRATLAIESNALHAEIVPLTVPARGADRLLVDQVPQAIPAPSPVEHTIPPDLQVDYQQFMPFITNDTPGTSIEHDESIRQDVSLSAMSALRPLQAGGSITAGNAPGLTDGAAALLIADADWAREHEYSILAEIVGYTSVAWEPAYLALTPALATQQLLAKHDLTPADIHVWEINEAFAAVALLSATHLGLPSDTINRLGGAIAMGHALGASGARIIASVVHQLRSLGGGLGVAAICSGGGQGDAMLIRVDRR